MRKKRIAIVSTDWNENEYRRKNKKYGGVSYYRAIKPGELLKEEYDVNFVHSGFSNISKGMSVDEFYDFFTHNHDMIIIKSVDNAGAIQPLIHWATKNNCILVQDFDDNMMMIREDQPAHKHGYQVAGQKRANVAAMMSLVDAIIVSTQPLKDYFSKFLKDVFQEEKDIYIYPNYNDLNDWHFPAGIKDPKKIVIGWAGSVTHDSDLKMMMPALGRVVDKYDNVYVELLGGIVQGNLGYITEGWSKNAKSKLSIKFGSPAWDEYPKLMREQPWDIGIAPLIDDEFNRGKSHIKWMEYAMCGIPTIASDVYPYRENIKDKETGLLAKETEWEEKLSFLIENPDERQRLATNAFQFIEENLQWYQHEKDYIDIVSSIFDKKAIK